MENHEKNLEQNFDKSGLKPGQLCWFWDDDESIKIMQILGNIEEESPLPYRIKVNLNVGFKYCQQLRSAEIWELLKLAPDYDKELISGYLSEEYDNTEDQEPASTRDVFTRDVLERVLARMAKIEKELEEYGN